MSTQLADFDATTGHLHDCIVNEGQDYPCNRDCTMQLYALAQNSERVSGNHEFVSMDISGIQCGCGEVITASLGQSKTAAWAIHVREAVFPRTPDYPECEGHNELQKRDGKVPWCSRCGWTRGQPAMPARKVGMSSEERVTRGSWG